MVNFHFMLTLNSLPLADLDLDQIFKLKSKLSFCGIAFPFFFFFYIIYSLQINNSRKHCFTPHSLQLFASATPALEEACKRTLNMGIRKPTGFYTHQPPIRHHFPSPFQAILLVGVCITMEFPAAIGHFQPLAT